MVIRLGFLMFFVFCNFMPNGVLAQKYVADTVLVEFGIKPNKQFNHNIYITDHRNESPDFISVYEKKKWLFFPVDQIVLTQKPVAKAIINNQASFGQHTYQLDIYEFYINYNETLFKRSLSLDGSLQLLKPGNAGDTNLMGMFYYEYSRKYKKKIPIEKAYSDLLKHFTDTFIYDANIVCSDTFYKCKPGNFHFRKHVRVAPKNLYVSADFYYGYTFWGFDAELWFSSPEPSQKFKRNSRMFRYLNYGNRQSVGFSAGVSQFNYRLNQNWLLQNKSAFLLGFNKWNDIDDKKRTLEEIFLFQFSMMQRVSFNRLDKGGFTFGGGLIEEASYIIHNKPIASIGVVITCAYKF